MMYLSRNAIRGIDKLVQSFNAAPVAPLDPHPATSARTTARARTVTRFNIGLLVREGQRGLAWLATDTSTCCRSGEPSSA